MPIRERDGLYIVENCFVVIVLDCGARANFTVIIADSELRQGRMSEDFAEVSEGLDRDCAVSWVSVVLPTSQSPNGLFQSSKAQQLTFGSIIG